jgi:Ca2+-binding RTX toxin-like protein
VDPIAGAVSYEWGFAQGGATIFALTTALPEFAFRSGDPGRDQVQPGQAQLSVRADLAGGGVVTGTTTITIGLRQPGPQFVYPADGQILDFEGDYLAAVVPPANVVSYDWSFTQFGDVIYSVTTTGPSFGFVASAPERDQVALGPAQISVRANLATGESFTSTRSVSIRLFSRTPTVSLAVSAPTEVDGTDLFDVTVAVSNLTTVALGGGADDTVLFAGSGLTPVVASLPVVQPGDVVERTVQMRAFTAPSTPTTYTISVAVYDDNSVPRGGTGTADVTGLPDSSDPCGSTSLVVCYAPELRFSNLETFFPKDPNDFVNNAELKWAADSSCFDPVANGQTLDDGTIVYVTPALIGSGALASYEIDNGCDPIETKAYSTTEFTRPGSPNPKVRPDDGRNGLPVTEGWFLNVDDAARQGSVVAPIFYVEYPDRIEYWMFYGHDPKSVLRADGLLLSHEGDWEHITVHLDGRRATTVGFYGHGCNPIERTYGVDVEVSGTHPVVYPAEGSHASYPEERDFFGAWPAGGCSSSLSGRTDIAVYEPGVSAVMQTWNNLRPVQAECWYGYGGAWGDTGEGLTFNDIDLINLAFGRGDDTGPAGPFWNLEQAPAPMARSCGDPWAPRSATLPTKTLGWDEQQTVTYDGAAPGLAFTMTMESVPVFLGTGAVGADGRANVTFTVPVGTPAGLHQVYVRETSTGEPLAVFAIDVAVPAQCVAGAGDVDVDGDGVADRCDPNLADGPDADPDGDGITNATDNCALVANPGQERLGDRSVGVVCDQREGYNPLADQVDPDPTGAPRCNYLVATIVGTAGADTIVGTSGDDIIVGLGGNDIISGGGGADLMCGGDGADTLRGGNDDDTILGGAGNDTINGDNGDDIAYGGTGGDIIGGDSNTADNGNDVIYGDTGPDQLSGGNGDDRLDGGADNDNLSGGNGNDTLDGNTGTDTGNAGQGTDTCRTLETATNCET